MASNKQNRRRLLSSTRPRNANSKTSSSSQTARALIRLHHILRKQLSSAIARGEDAEAKAIKAEIEASGGLSKYQEASIQGQSAERGGDSSKMLMEWLAELRDDHEPDFKSKGRLRLLEVGSLRPNNACSRSGIFDMKRIDLHSQHPEIEEQDFMTMQSPGTDRIINEGFDVVSLSLVVNFVSDAVQRGEMLRRVEGFFRPVNDDGDNTHEYLPALFLVLPASCVSNSRYLDEPKLREIMESLGYDMMKRKLSPKLVYYLWQYRKPIEDTSKAFKKKELRQGRSRNNFAIVLQ